MTKIYTSHNSRGEGYSGFALLRRYTTLVTLESGRLEQAIALVVYSLFSNACPPALNPIVAVVPHSMRLQS